MSGEPPIDAWTTIDEKLGDIRDQLTQLNSNVTEAIRGQRSTRRFMGGDDRREGGSSPQEFITFPKYPEPPDTNVRTTINNIAGVIPKDRTTFDFVNGSVKREQYENAKMSQALASLDSDFIRSMDIYSDTSIRIRIPDSQDQTGVGMFENEFRDLSLRDVRVKKMEVLSHEPAVVTIIASTEPDLGFVSSGGPIAKHRVAVETTSNADNRVNVDDTWTDLFWSPEETAITGDNTGIITREALEIPSNSSPMLLVENFGDFDIGVAMFATTKKYDWTTGSNIDYAEMDGWTENNPQVVTGGAGTNREMLDLGEAFSGGVPNAKYIMISSKQVEQAGESSDVQFTFMADQ